MFVLRKPVEKSLESHGDMAIGFMDLKEAFDTVPGEKPETRIVEAMCGRTKGRVLVGHELPNNCLVNISLNHGSALNLLLFIMVMELLSRNISTKDV